MFPVDDVIISYSTVLSALCILLAHRRIVIIQNSHSFSEFHISERERGEREEREREREREREGGGR